MDDALELIRALGIYVVAFTGVIAAFVSPHVAASRQSKIDADRIAAEVAAEAQREERQWRNARYDQVADRVIVFLGLYLRYRL
ncbi:MAG: hypothetical protein O3B84_03120 [Chloroflexi bacterium]|nr:hypothetical protein [Chloroflexota bacterium]